MAAFSHRHKKRKLKAEINVVPYIDVMLVLLVIFMVTASVVNLSVDVDLPDSNARSVQAPEQDPVVVSVAADGTYTLKLGEASPQPVSAADLGQRMRAFVAQNPKVPVFVAADGQLPYQAVMDTMAMLQAAGVDRAGLMSEPVGTER